LLSSGRHECRPYGCDDGVRDDGVRDDEVRRRGATTGAITVGDALSRIVGDIPPPAHVFVPPANALNQPAP
jgi:hypothetical protein